MSMESMEPNPDWDVAGREDVVDAFAALGDGVTITVWGADWCPDTRDVLPDFAAVLDAANVDWNTVRAVEVDRDKNGEGTEEYGIELIPSIVIERDGEEIARFIEEEDVPAAVYLANQFADVAPSE